MRAWCIWLAGLFAAAAACDGGSSPPPACTGPDCPCPAGTAKCGDTCIDITHDAANCGGCGHACSGSACLAGICQPESIALVPNAPAELVLDGDDLVLATSGKVTSNGAIYRVPKAGGAVEVVYRGLGGQPSLAVSADAILVADSEQSDACKATSSAGSILSISDGVATLYSMARRCARWMLPSDGGLTWVEEAPLTHFNTGEPGPWLARLPGGTLPDTAPTLLHGPRYNGIAELVRRGETLLWRENNPHAILQMPVAGGAATTLANLPINAVAHAVDAERLAYAVPSTGPFVSDGHVTVRTLATGEELTIPDVGDVRRVALDASLVYWIAAGDVWAADPRSAERRQLTHGGAAAELAVDDRFVYALRELARGGWPRTEVLRVRKPAITAPLPTPSGQCRGPLVQCEPPPFFEDSCVDVTTDPDHCGDCATVCGAGEHCTGGRCVCAATSLLCGGGCVDPATDANHCGRCGRSCAGGSCNGGDCRPARMGEGGHTAVQDASALYYARNGQMKRLDKQSQNVTMIAQLAHVRTLASDGSRLYVIESSGAFGTIHALAKTGAGGPTPLYSGRVDPRQLAVAGDAVVWVEDGSFSGPPATLVHAAANGSGIRGSFQPTSLYPGGQDDDSVDLAVAGSTIYWLLRDPLAARGAIVRIDLAATPPAASLVTALEGYPAALAIAGDRLYVTGGEDGALLSVPTTGGPITVHAKGLVDATTVAVAPDGSIYWADGDGSYRVIRRLVPGVAGARVVQQAPSGRDSLFFGFDGDRLYTVWYSDTFVLTL